MLTGVGGDIDFVDQSAGPAYVHQYSVDVKRELPGRVAVSVGYLGSRSERLAVGGTIDARVNINQLDPQYLALGTALQEPVPNPFFGISAFGARALAADHPARRAAAAVSAVHRTCWPIASARRARGTTRCRSPLERRQHDGWGRA